MLFFFGGAFEIGDKGDADVKAWCDSLAHHGYCAAAVNYRLGFNVASTASAIRAVYRAVQDSRAAIRFFKEKNNFYKIDTTQIFVGGESAGAITALHTAYLDKDVKAPNELHGSLTEWQDLGCLNCVGSYRRHTVDPKGIISLWGAVYQLSYIEPQINVPTLMIHGTADWIVPYDQGRPFTGSFPSTFPWVYGSVQMNNRLTATNIYHEFYPYQGQSHVFYGLPTGIVTFPNQYWNPVWAQGRNFLYKIMSFNTPTPTGNLTAAFGSTNSYSVAYRAGSTYCWQVAGGTVLAYSNNNATAQIRWNTSGTRSITLTETDYKQLAGASANVTIGSLARVSPNNPNNPSANSPIQHLAAYPNPLGAGQPLTLDITSAAANNATATVYDAFGQRLADYQFAVNAGDNKWQLPTTHLPQGTYIIAVTVADSREAVKLVIQ